MARKHTSKPARRPPPQVLELRVSSPRIVLFRILEGVRRLLKLALVAGAVGGLLWAVGLGLRKAFLENDDFRLALIDLNPNPVLDERGLAELGGIDLNGSIFAADVSRLEAQLEALPELALAKVERELPGTLRVRLRARVPVAWIEMPARQLAGRDAERGLLVDPNGIVFRCVGGLGALAEGLPVLVITDEDEPQPVPGTVCRAPELKRGLDMLALSRKVPGMEAVAIERIEQANRWSIRLRTGDGIDATLGLVDHRRQLSDLVTARAHAEQNGYRIRTIDLIPQRNIPVTVDAPAPPRAIPVSRPPAAPPPVDRQRQDLESLLNRG